MNYAFIENGKVASMGQLPRSWRNISGLHLATDEELRKWGWLPVTVVEASPALGQTRDVDEVTVHGDHVLVAQRVRQKTPVEVANDWIVLRTTRDLELHQSDWTQGNDSPLSNVEKEEWTVWRRAMRDLPSATSEPTNPSWPTKPGS